MSSGRLQALVENVIFSKAMQMDIQINCQTLADECFLSMMHMNLMRQGKKT